MLELYIIVNLSTPTMASYFKTTTCIAVLAPTLYLVGAEFVYQLGHPVKLHPHVMTLCCKLIAPID
jgi:hypothetical protein